MSAPRLILASSSPRRRELLALLGHPFRVIPSDVEERFDPDAEPSVIVEDLALRKALSVSESLSEGVIVGSDTVVVLPSRERDSASRRRILGKPANREDALCMLMDLAGRVHHVYTGLAVVDAGSGQRALSHCRTSVRMRRADSEELFRYVESGEPLDKAGAYAAQGMGSVLIDEIRGDFFNIVGLPLSLLGRMMTDFGFETFPCGTGRQNLELIFPSAP